jgi:hypothetical protein
MTARVLQFWLLHALMSAETNAGTGRILSVVAHVVGAAINLGRKTIVTIEVKKREESGLYALPQLI